VIKKAVKAVLVASSAFAAFLLFTRQLLEFRLLLEGLEKFDYFGGNL